MLTTRKAASYLGLAALAALGLAAAQPTHAQAPAVTLTPDPGSTFNNGIGYSLGYEFTTNSAVTVDALGYFQDTASFTEDHPVAIYTSSGVLVASADVNNGTITSKSGDFAYTNIAPITLAAGGDYVVTGASGVVDDYTFDPTTFAMDPSINFVQDRFLGNGGATADFPTETAGLTGFFGASFLLAPSASAVPEPSSVAAFAFTGFGALGLILKARKRKAVSAV